MTVPFGRKDFQLEAGFAQVVERNIRALIKVRQQLDERRTLNERIADAVTRCVGSVWFAYVHAVLVAAWLLVNSGKVPGVTPFDPFPFVMLAMIASVEAIFLSTFVLVSQNRAARVAERRAELDLQINLLAEHEITELVHQVAAIAKKLGVGLREEQLEASKMDVSPEAVLEHIDRVERDVRS